MAAALACCFAAAVASAPSPPATASASANAATAHAATAHGADAPPPPDVDAGERSDGRLDPIPRRRWRLVPQVLLFPLRALFWGLEWPIGAALRVEDRVHPFRRALDALTWSGGTRGLRPAFYYSTIYIPEFGLRYYDHLTLGVDTNLEVTTTVGGANYVYSGLTVEPTRTTAPIGVIFDVLFDRRGDLLYNGFGSHTYSAAPAGRYLMNAVESRLAVRVRPQPWLAFYATISTGLKRFQNGDRVGGDPGVVYVWDTNTIPGFTHGTSFIRAGVGGILDLRDHRSRASTGLLIDAAFDYTRGIDGDFATYERFRAKAGVPIPLWLRTHVLWLQAATALAWQDGPVAIPFTEVPTLGGPDDLRGFRFQDFRDLSSFWVTAEYRWPMWMWVDGALFFDYGGVFGRNYAGFNTQRMQPDVGVALRVVTNGHFLLRIQIGYGFGEGVNFSLSGNGP